MTNLAYTACCLFKCLQLCATLWTVAHQAPLSMGFPRQEYLSGFPCTPPGDIPNPGIKLASLKSPALPGRFFSFLEKEMATHSSILAWRIPWTEEPGQLQFMGSQVRHDLVPFLSHGSVDKEPPAMKETRVQFLDWEDPLEKEMATHSSISAWRIPWTEEPGQL